MWVTRLRLCARASASWAIRRRRPSRLGEADQDLVLGEREAEVAAQVVVEPVDEQRHPHDQGAPGPLLTVVEPADLGCLRHGGSVCRGAPPAGVERRFPAVSRPRVEWRHEGQPCRRPPLPGARPGARPRPGRRARRAHPRPRGPGHRSRRAPRGRSRSAAPGPPRRPVPAWTLRGAPHAYRRSEAAGVAAAVAPWNEADAAKRIFDASRPLTPGRASPSSTPWPSSPARCGTRPRADRQGRDVRAP